MLDMRQDMIKHPPNGVKRPESMRLGCSFGAQRCVGEIGEDHVGGYPDRSEPAPRLYLVPQAPGGRVRSLGSSHKLGRAVALARGRWVALWNWAAVAPPGHPR